MPEEVLDDTQQPTDPDPEPEGIVTDPQSGQKMVPLGAVAGERDKRKALETRLKDMEAQLQAIEPIRQRASQVDQLTGELRSVKEQLQQFQPKPQIPQVSDEEAETYARDFELYDATTGKLDLPRAKRMIAREEQKAVRMAEKIVEQKLGPVQEQGAAASSRQNFGIYAMQPFPDGTEPTREFQTLLARKWTEMGPMATQSAEICQVVRDAALGEYLRTKGKGVPRAEREPLVTEPAGGQQRASYQITDLERKFAKDHNMKVEDWTSRAKQFVPGQINVLE